MATNELFVLTQDDPRLLNYRRKKWMRSAEFHRWLQQEELVTLTMDQSMELYRASGGRDTAQFKTNTIEDIRAVSYTHLTLPTNREV